MKICFEGPSGIGKTTICREMEKDYVIIPEVNVLFKGEKNEGRLWYFQKQVERYQLSQRTKKVIFDGDIFQPFWYNWTYNYPDGFLSLKEMSRLYLEEIKKKNITFPDLYLVFYTSIENLIHRKANDLTRNRGNFEKHLKLIETLPLYFQFMQKSFPKMVSLIQYDSVYQVKPLIEAAISERGNTTYDSLRIFQTMVDWLSKNEPGGN